MVVDLRRKALIAVILVLAPTLVADAANRVPNTPGLKWEHDIRVAWQASVKSDRPLLVFISTDACTYCQKMKRTTLRDRTIVQTVQSRFIPVAINAKDEPELLKKLKVTALPTTVVVESNGDVVGLARGFQTPKQLRERLLSPTRQVSHQGRPKTGR